MGLPWINGVICFFHKSGKTLLIDYRDYPHKIHEGKYSLPGGKLNDGESSEKAGIRESWEEARIIARGMTYRGRVHFNNEERTVLGKPMKINMSVDIYDCFDFDDSHAEATEEKDGRRAKLEWVADDKVLSINELHEGDRKMLEWLRDYKEFEGTIKQVGERLSEANLEYYIAA